MMHPAAPSASPYARERLRREAERRWRRLGDAYPYLAETIAYGRDLVALYIDDLPAPAPLDLTVERARRKLDEGRPLLDGEELAVDAPGLRHFLFRLSLWASRQPALGEGGTRLECALLDGQLAAEQLFDAALTEDDDALGAVARNLGVPEALVRTLAGYLVVAALLSTARPLRALLVEVNHPWGHPICPICGGPPLLAELVGEHADRWLRCAACGTGWRFRADRCVRCGTTDSPRREILSIGEQRLPNRLELCRHCRGYLKLATVPAPTPPELLTITDAAFVALEEAARDQGYGPTVAR